MEQHNIIKKGMKGRNRKKGEEKEDCGEEGGGRL